MNRAEIDEIAWKSIFDRPKRQLSEANGKRSLNYSELNDRLKAGVDFEHAWSDFLHAFYDYRDATFFVDPSPASLSPGWQALLAGAAEWLSDKFALPARPGSITRVTFSTSLGTPSKRITGSTCRSS
jgi:hypothetical protein